MHEQEGSSTSTRHSDTSVNPSKEIGYERVFGIGKGERGTGGVKERGLKGSTYELLAINARFSKSSITMLHARVTARVGIFLLFLLLRRARTRATTPFLFLHGEGKK